MVSSFLSLLSDDLQVLFLSRWLDVRSLVTLDAAVSSHRLRPYWLTLLRCLNSAATDDWDHSSSSLNWLSRRGIRPFRLQMKIDNWRVEGCHMQLQYNGSVHDVYSGQML